MGRFSPTVVADYGRGIDVERPAENFTNALIASRERKQRQKQLDIENARQKTLDDERHTSFDLGMRREGYTPAPPDDPQFASTPQPFRVGNYLQTGVGDDEMKQNRIEARRALLAQGLSDFNKTGDPSGLFGADAAEGASIYEGVSRGQDYHARAMGTGYYDRPEVAPRPIDRYSPAGVAAQKDIDANRERLRGRRGGGGGGAANVSQRQRAVAAQIDDTRADLGRVEREEAPAMKRPLEATPYPDSKGRTVPADPAAVSSFLADSTRAAGRVGALRQRADSLTRVNDDLVGQLGGARPLPPAPLAPRGGTPAPTARAPEPGSPEAYQAEMNGLHDLALKAAKEGTPEVEINAALAAAAARINKKYRRAP